MANEADEHGTGVREALRRLATVAGSGRFEQALAAYESARVDGLCHEGAWECAMAALHEAAAADSRLNYQHGAIGLGDDQSGEIFQ